MLEDLARQGHAMFIHQPTPPLFRSVAPPRPMRLCQSQLARPRRGCLPGSRRTNPLSRAKASVPPISPTWERVPCHAGNARLTMLASPHMAELPVPRRRYPETCRQRRGRVERGVKKVEYVQGGRLDSTCQIVIHCQH